MSETKHTPYPWFVVEMQPRKHSTASRYLIQSGEANICTLDVAGREPGRDEANARLIAAAPDLLEALQAFLDVAPSEGHRCLYCDVSVYGTNDVDDHLPDCEMAKGYAAIAKAKGD
jgi:hypothetical protein